MLPLAPERQAAAESGKDLPEAAADDPNTSDPAAAPLWFAALPLPIAAIVQTPIVGRAEAGTAIPQTATTPIGGPPIVPTPDSAAAATAPPAEQVASTLASADTRAQAVPPKTPDSVSAAVRHGPGVAPKPMIDASRIAFTATAAQVLAPVDGTAHAIAVSTLPQPAGQVFATARAIAGSWREREPRGDRVDATAMFTTAAPIELRERAMVHAAADTAQTALDLTADSGLQRMIDRIETLRDAADSRDTRIRLIPDALGGIDVAVRREGDRVHVRFTAEHDATRALIADAQPRLTELAAARGVRIGDTSVSTGSGGGGTMPQPRATASRVPASAAVATPTDPTTDHRLA